MVKRKPHHPLAAIKIKFASVTTLEMTTTAAKAAVALGYDRAGVVAVVQGLASGDFVKSETAHSPPNSRVWHDTYTTTHDDYLLYLKFAGETLLDLVLVSFKEA